MHLIDTHCHVSYEDFNDDRDETIARAQAAGVEGMLNVATDPEWWARYLSVAEKHPSVRVALGFHPNHAQTFSEQALKDMRDLLIKHKDVAVAVGETGLDTFRDHCPIDVQRVAFQAQLDLAAELDLPFILHCRSTEKEMLGMLKAQHEKLGRPLRGVWHCFTATPAFAHEAVALGLHLGFGGVVTYPRAPEVRAAAKITPADRILLETDAPFLPPQPNRRKRNEPAFVVETAKKLAEVRGVWVEQIAEQTTQNARALFNAWSA